MNSEDIFDKKSKVRWYHYAIHLGYYLPFWAKFFVSEPFKESKKDLNIFDNVNSILSSETSDDNIRRCKELIYLHRVVENTRARRRLEKWSLRVIAIYLFIVMLIVVLCYSKIPFISDFIQIKIPNSIMITILSTTTVNIIGLGLIVLRGHFLANDNNASKK